MVVAAKIRKVSPVRGVRQHVNPLGAYYMVPRAEQMIVPPQYQRGRLEVELGCAEAKFSFELAQREPETFVVGLEIRHAMVERNQKRAAALDLPNLRFAYVNLNVDLDRVFLPQTVDRFHLLFPDPWFKSRHNKRRVVDERWCEVIASQLKPGGELHVATDVWDIGIEALSELESEMTQDLGFRNLFGPWKFARENPSVAQSRREDTTIARGQRVWRMRFVKT